MTEITRTLVQCDFDGTITEEDVSFMLLDAFADRDWRQLHRDFEEGKMSVGRFNTDAFAMVKADRNSLLKIARNGVKIKPGFHQMVTCCRRKGFRLVIVSNGLDFYIEEILKDIGLGDIEFFAAQTHFHPEGSPATRLPRLDGQVVQGERPPSKVPKGRRTGRAGLKVQYIGPDGSHLDSDFKMAYVNLFLGEGYRVIYMGNGISDFAPASRCHYVFATGNLLARCRQTNLDCTPFTDFNQVVSVLESL